MISRRPNQTRWVTLSVALLCLVGQLGSVLHLAVVRHVTCAEHGELVEAAVHPGTVLSAEHRRSGAEVTSSAAIEATPPDHGHDHCIVSGTRRAFTASARTTSPTAEAACEAGDPLWVNAAVPAPAIPLLIVAPKGSPPA